MVQLDGDGLFCECTDRIAGLALRAVAVFTFATTVCLVIAVAFAFTAFARFFQAAAFGFYFALRFVSGFLYLLFHFTGYFFHFVGGIIDNIFSTMGHKTKRAKCVMLISGEMLLISVG